MDSERRRKGNAGRNVMYSLERANQTVKGGHICSRVPHTFPSQRILQFTFRPAATTADTLHVTPLPAYR